MIGPLAFALVQPRQRRDGFSVAIVGFQSALVSADGFQRVAQVLLVDLGHGEAQRPPHRLGGRKLDLLRVDPGQLAPLGTGFVEACQGFQRALVGLI